jgi:hypothetical protein
VSLQATELLPLLLDTAPADAASREALERLSSWNREFAPESAAAAAALARMPEDELGETPLGTVRVPTPRAGGGTDSTARASLTASSRR